MPLDITLFRADQGGNPDLIRESQRRRFRDPETVDEVIALDDAARKLVFQVDRTRFLANNVSRTMGAKAKAKEDPGPDVASLPEEILEHLLELEQPQLEALTMKQLRLLGPEYKKLIAQLEEEKTEVISKRDKIVSEIGNIVHESVPLGSVKEEDEKNAVLRTWGEVERQHKYNHVVLMKAIGGMDTETGTRVAGNRCYFLQGPLVLLKMALENYAMQFLTRKGFSPMYTPFFMEKDAMAQVAQLSQFDEELYKVSGEGSEKYLIATSEQTICGYFTNEWISPTDLPLRVAGISTCFRKEVGKHGKDTLGIFRVHQFEKIEQFVVTGPNEGESWEMQKEMIANSEEFVQALGLPYRVVNICSGALNNAAAMKYDLEALFPASEPGEKFRELVSCSNCTDYQARAVECRFGLASRKGQEGATKEYCHMLNSTLCALTRVLCCMLENHQTPEGIQVPEVLHPFLPESAHFIPFLEDVEAIYKATILEQKGHVPLRKSERLHMLCQQGDRHPRQQAEGEGEGAQ